MRVCLVSIHPRLLSGQINSLVGLAHALRKRDHDVRLVTAFAEARLNDPDRVYGPEAHAGILLTKLTRVARIVRHLQQCAGDADVVQLNLPTPSFSIVGDMVQHLLKRPIIVGFEAHLLSKRDYPRVPIHQAPSFYLPWISMNNHLTARLSGFRASRYVVASMLQAQELRNFGVSPERIHVIPNPIDLSRLREDVDSGLDGVPWPIGGPIISYIGHFNHVKGVDILIRALPAVLQAHPTAHLVIAWSGLGPDAPIKRAIAEANVSHRVHIIGRVPVGAVLHQSDVVVLPYRLTIGQAAYPGLVLEAMATGAPLVTSDLPLLRELGRPGEIAELARPEDPIDLANRINYLLGNPDHCAAMVRRQQSVVRELFDADTLARRYEELYGYHTYENVAAARC